YDVVEGWARKHGLLSSLYVDRDSIYRCEGQPSIPEQLEGKKPQTQFGRAMEDLGVELILANSPQAKGRVERMNGTLQDRLVKELRLREVRDVAAANAVLDGPFLKRFNKKFAVRAAKKADVHRAVPAAVKLDEVLCKREERAVGHDWCVQWRGRLL